MTRRSRLGDSPPTPDRTGGSCQECDPPEDLRRSLGSAVGAYRYQHYREFVSTDDLETHLRAAVPRFTAGVLGYDFDQWLAGVKDWHRRDRAWKEADERRGWSGTVRARPKPRAHPALQTIRSLESLIAYITGKWAS